MEHHSALREALITRLGHFPEQVALELQFGTHTELSDHRRTLVTYQVEAGERVSAWLLFPKGESPVARWPGILALHQHAGQYDLGKAETAGLAGPAMAHYGLDLCRRGYVVLCPDHLCFEDRRPPLAARAAKGAYDGVGYERFEFTRRLLAGSCLQTKYLHDLTCALDLLASLPQVNNTRLGVIGHSLGGQEALWLAWYDPRVVAAVSSCGFSLLRTIIRDAINHNFAAYIPSMLELCDVDALVVALAPRAFLLTAGETDPLFPIDGVRDLVVKAQEAYAQAGVPEHFRAVLFPGGHDFPGVVKAEAYAFLDRWLM